MKKISQHYLVFEEKKAPAEFNKKTKQNKIIIDQAAFLIKKLGIPFDELSLRRIERMAIAFLSVCQINSKQGWAGVKDINNGVSMKTRDIINYANKNFEENISSGSYDDIRRKDLKLLVLSEIVLRTNPRAARNDATRGYALNPKYSKLIKSIGAKNWDRLLNSLLKNQKPMSEIMAQKRDIGLIPITLSTGKKLSFSTGEHNILQKAIIEDFLPRFGYGAEVLYVGDTADKFLFMNKEKLLDLNFFELSHGELPDVVAYSKKRNWLYLIEAVHSSGPISTIRLMELQKLTENCKADIVYVTAFLDRETFRKFVKDIAWETEAWIASAPDHLVHFNGDKFMGPYKK